MKYKIAIPHYVLELPSGTYVVDAYFINKVSHKARKSLLIFPTSVITGMTYSDSDIVILETNLDIHEVYEEIKNAYEYVKREVFSAIRKALHRSQLRILIPVPRSMVENIDHEYRGALIIFEKVFSGCSLHAERDIKSWSRVYVTAEIHVSKDILSVKAPKPVPRIYSWLYNVDEGFRNALNKVLLI